MSKNSRINLLSWKQIWAQPINRMLFKFIGLLSLFYALWVSPFFQEYFVQFVAHIYAQIGGFLLNILGYGVDVKLDVVSNDIFAIGIKNGCDGIEGLAVFLIAVGVYPSSLKLKLTGIFWGCLFLILLNLMRIVSLFLCGIYTPNIFDIMHESIWQVVFIALSLLAFFVWVNWTRVESF